MQYSNGPCDGIEKSDMDNEQILTALNNAPPPCMVSLGASILSVSTEDATAELSFDMPLAYCHSGDIVQGGFVTGMLDAAMTMAVFAAQGGVVNLPSLEIKVSFLAPSRAGKFIGKGRILRAGKSIVFLEGELFDEQGVLTATSSSTAKVIPLHK